MVGGGDPFYLKFWVNRPPLQSSENDVTVEWMTHPTLII